MTHMALWCGEQTVISGIPLITMSRSVITHHWDLENLKSKGGEVPREFNFCVACFGTFLIHFSDFGKFSY